MRNIKVLVKSAEVLVEKAEAEDTRQQRRAVHIHKPAAILVRPISLCTSDVITCQLLAHNYKAQHTTQHTNAPQRQMNESA
jgi:hypothetical protein